METLKKLCVCVEMVQQETSFSRVVNEKFTRCQQKNIHENWTEIATTPHC